MAEIKDKKITLTESNSTGAKGINEAIELKRRDFRSSPRSTQEDRTAMIFNESTVFARRKDGVVREVFRGGWYLSPEENAVKEQLLEANAELNKTILAQMEEEGVQTVFQPPQFRNSEVIR